MASVRVGGCVRVVHVRDGEERLLADEVRLLESVFSRMRGLMLRSPLESGEGLVFTFDRVGTRRLHAMFVVGAFDAVWVRGTTVDAVKRMRPWIGYGRGRADIVVELPAGVADDVQPGDTIEVRPG